MHHAQHKTEFTDQRCIMHNTKQNSAIAYVTAPPPPQKKNEKRTSDNKSAFISNNK
jgi:hypothetical protein